MKDAEPSQSKLNNLPEEIRGFSYNNDDDNISITLQDTQRHLTEAKKTVKTIQLKEHKNIVFGLELLRSLLAVCLCLTPRRC